MNRRKQQGTSTYKGVNWHRQHQKWQAQIAKDKKNYHLGYFTSELEAAKAYDAKAKEFFGEFAHLNFPNPIGSKP